MRHQRFDSPSPSRRARFVHIALLIQLLATTTCLTQDNKEKLLGKDVAWGEVKPGTWKEIAPLTDGNLRAHKTLHNEGWKVIPSSDKAWKSAMKSGQMSARHAKALVLVGLGENAAKYPGKLGNTMKTMYSWGIESGKPMLENSSLVLRYTKELAASELVLSAEAMGEAWKALSVGYMSLGERTVDDFQEMKRLPGGYFSNLKEDFSNIYEMASTNNQKNTEKIALAWKDSFAKARKEFQDHYEASGQRENALIGLVDIFKGYFLSIGQAIVRPTVTTAALGGEMILVNGVVVPLSSAFSFSGRSLMTTGLVLYYPAKIGIKVISPSVEAGFLSAFSLLSAASTVPTLLTGATLAAFNHITVIGGFTTATAAGMAGGAIIDTAATGAAMIYDVGTGAAQTGFYAMKTGVVLGYTALTALPAHLFLASLDSVFFLAWDGTRLVVAAARGNIQALEEMPTGTVVDIEKLRKLGVKVDVITDDEKTVNKVIESQADDLREKSK